MKNYTNVTIWDGSTQHKRRVTGDYLPDGGFDLLGWLMPQVSDSRQQPKSLAFKLREELNAKS